MIDTVFGALAQMLPDRVIAASEGGNTGVSIGGYHADRSPFIFVEFICSAWGGRPWADGLDGNANLFANMSLPSAEVTETEQPLEILVLRAHARRRRPRQAPRGHVGAARLPAARGRGGAAGARRPPHLPAVRPLRRRAGQAVAQLPADRRRGARAHRQGHDDADAPGRRVRRTSSRAPAAGATRSSAIRRGSSRRAQRTGERGGGPRRLRRGPRSCRLAVDEGATVALRQALRARGAGPSARW